MAVQKSKKSRAKRGSRRSHDRTQLSTLSTDSVTGEIHRRHHVSDTGFYRGVEIIKTQDEHSDDDS